MNLIKSSAKWCKHNIFYILDVVKLVGVLFLVVMFINFNVIVAKQAQDTKSVVNSQHQILEAIKKLAEDTNITAEQKTNTIICMLQVPVEQRTTNVLEGCRNKAIKGLVTNQIYAPKVQAP